MPARAFDVVFLAAGGVLVHPDGARVVAHLATAGISVDAAALLEAHYRGMLAADVAGSGPEEFDAYQHAYVGHLGLIGPVAKHAVDLLDALFAAGGLWTEPLPWARDGLAAIGATGLPIVIVSNADGTVDQLLAAHELLQVGPGPGCEVAAIIDSGVVGVAKPDPRIFELALASVGASADRAVYVGDAWGYDVVGARAAGVTPVLLDPLGLRPDADCTRLASLVDLPELLNGTERPAR